MKATGGCLCGQIRYEVDSDTFIAVSCHCRDCQYVTGGEPAVAIAVPADTVRTVKGHASRLQYYRRFGNARLQIVLRRLRNTTVCRQRGSSGNHRRQDRFS